MQNIKFEARFLGKGADDREDGKTWEHFRWEISINGERFSYRTGTGHFTRYFGTGRPGETVWDSQNKRNKKPEDRPVLANSELGGWLHVPTALDVLECLLSDMDAGAESFDNFCANFGYSNDSLKALDIYRECMAIAPRIRKALGAELENVRKAIEERNS